MDNNERLLIWAAGFFSGLGGFQIITNNGTPVIRFQGSTQIHREGMLKLAEAMDVNVAEVKQKNSDKVAYKITSSSKPLHAAMTRFWPYLTDARKREYRNLRKELKIMTESA